MDKEMIVPYFPFGIRVVSNDSYKETSMVKELYSDSFLIVDRWDNSSKIPYDTELYQLVLHPITFEHLYKPLRVNTKELIVADYLCKIVYENIKDLKPAEESEWLVEIIVSYFNDKTSCPFSNSIISKICSVLYALHFDMFGYIAQKKARDVCEMTYDSYEFDKILL